MKYFRCINEDCPAHVPRNGQDNHVLECVQVYTPLDEEGSPVQDLSKVRAQFIGLECGLCGEDVEELTPEKAITCKITKVTPEFIVGQFQNALRGEGTFNFALRLSTGDVLFKEDTAFSPMEAGYIREFCRQEYYDKGILVEITDCYQDYGRKVYHATIQNLADQKEFVVEATDRDILDLDGPRELNPLERNKLFETIRQSPY